MDKNANLRHWDEWANTYGEGLRATTKCQTIKQIEIEALTRAIRSDCRDKTSPTVLEVGCGNGFNAIGLPHNFPSMKCHGVDFSAKMIESARTLASRAFDQAARRPAFGVADARIRPESIVAVTPIGLVFDVAERCCDIGLKMEATLDLDAHCRAFPGNFEYDRLFAVTLEDLPAFLRQNSSRIVPTSIALLDAIGHR